MGTNGTNGRPCVLEQSRKSADLKACVDVKQRQLVQTADKLRLREAALSSAQTEAAAAKRMVVRPWPYMPMLRQTDTSCHHLTHVTSSGLVIRRVSS